MQLPELIFRKKLGIVWIDLNLLLFLLIYMHSILNFGFTLGKFLKYFARMIIIQG